MTSHANIILGPSNPLLKRATATPI